MISVVRHSVFAQPDPRSARKCEGVHALQASREGYSTCVTQDSIAGPKLTK